ncbi:MAG: hypothetical protein H0W86_08490 [Armatimonadetes bacterium]|nr:hypothetical protein [Armatimonadota bacterium]
MTSIILLGVALLQAQAPISVRFKAVTPIVSVGQDVVFRAQATNKTEHEILLVPQGDSMHGGRKAPTVQVQIRKVGGEWHVPTLPGCGNTNPARPADFVAVKPGETIDFVGWDGLEQARSAECVQRAGSLRGAPCLRHDAANRALARGTRAA